MIKEIEKPDFFHKIWYDNDHYYFNDITNEYFILNNNFADYYFNEEGYCHRTYGPAVYSDKLSITIYMINGISYYEENFAKKTNHLICKFCEKFCKQECFA